MAVQKKPPLKKSKALRKIEADIVAGRTPSQIGARKAAAKRKVNRQRGMKRRPVPATTHDDVQRPDHYQFTIRALDGHEAIVDVAAVIEALFLQDAHLAQAFKYMARAGRKLGQPYTKDVAKSRYWHDRALKFHNAEVPK